MSAGLVAALGLLGLGVAAWLCLFPPRTARRAVTWRGDAAGLGALLDAGGLACLAARPGRAVFTGIVDRAGPLPYGRDRKEHFWRVVFRTGRPAEEFLVYARFPAGADRPALEALEPGDRIAVSGELRHLGGGVVGLFDCRLGDPDAPGAPEGSP